MTKSHEPPPDDSSEDDSPPQPPSKVYRTHAGEMIGTASEAAKTMAGLPPSQAIVLLAMLLMGFVCATQAFQTWNDREERRTASQERKDSAASTIRENNAQVEMTRQHCTTESTNLRAYFAEQTDRRMRFESEERAKDREALNRLSSGQIKQTESLNALLASFEELRKVLLKKHE